MGYGKTPPKVKWPDEARIAVQIVVNFEEGAENSVLRGDRMPEQFGDFPPIDLPMRDLGLESVFEYGSRVGIWRMLDLFDSEGIKVTFYACGEALEANPEAARDIVKRGHEICSHGYRWYDHFRWSEEESREDIRKAVKTIERLTGTRPVGWYCREPSPNTIELLAEEGGFAYNSDVYNDDLPYYVNVQGKKFLLIPYTPDGNDFHYFSNRFANAEEFFQYLKDTFDYLREEAKLDGKLMSIGTHVRISGRPGRTVALDRFFKYAKQFDDVWFARRIDIAKWWIAHYT